MKEKRFILEALEKRRRDILDLLDADSDCIESVPGSETQEAGDIEETLRILMVILWPKLMRSETGSQTADLFFNLLFQLSDAALSEDLRFLDAWNNAFEAIAELSLTDDQKKDIIAPFLVRYNSILEYQIERYRKSC